MIDLKVLEERVDRFLENTTKQDLELLLFLERYIPKHDLVDGDTISLPAICKKIYVAHSDYRFERNNEFIGKNNKQYNAAA